VNNNTGSVTNWVTANNVTNVLFYNASEIDSKDNRLDGFIESAVTFPNGTIHIGDKYEACTIVLNDNNLVCNTGFNSPLIRPESSSVILP
jgi:hypothetical protein